MGNEFLKSILADRPSVTCFDSKFDKGSGSGICFQLASIHAALNFVLHELIREEVHRCLTLRLVARIAADDIGEADFVEHSVGAGEVDAQLRIERGRKLWLESI